MNACILFCLVRIVVDLLINTPGSQCPLQMPHGIMHAGLNRPQRALNDVADLLIRQAVVVAQEEYLPLRHRQALDRCADGC